MITKIKQLRLDIDGLAQLTKLLKPIEHKMYGSIGGKLESEWSNTKEIEKAYDSLILAKAWLGKVLGELGTDSPYKSGYKEVSDIEPTADKANISQSTMASVNLENGQKIAAHFYELNHIEKVDWLRSSLEEIVQETIKIDIKSTREFAIARTNSYNHLSEARFHLGFELQRIKEESNK